MSETKGVDNGYCVQQAEDGFHKFDSLRGPRETWSVNSGSLRGRRRGKQESERTPVHRFLQLEPSWLRKGQTTSLLASVMEKDDVKDDLGGILTAAWPKAVESTIEFENR